MSLQKEIDDLVRKLNAVANNTKKESQAAFRIAAKPLVSAIKANAPESDSEHYRYKGGKIVATYKPGNLRRSIKTLQFRRSAAVFVGPKLDKSGSGGMFAGNKTDGYYAHWVEYGTMSQMPQPFVRPAVQTAGPAALSIAVKELKNSIDNYAKKIAR